MVFFSQQMLRIAVELALHEPLYEEFVEKFFEHTLWIAGAMDRVGEHQDEMWDEEDGFFYDVLRLPDGERHAFEGALDGRACCRWRRWRSSRKTSSKSCRRFGKRAREFMDTPPRTGREHAPAGNSRAWPAAACCRSWTKRSCAASSRACSTRPSSSGRTAFARCRVTTWITPFVFNYGGQEYRVAYVPGDSDTRHVRRQFQLARAGLDAGQLPAVHSLLRLGAYYGETSRWSARLARGNDDLVRGGAGAGASDCAAIFLRSSDRRAARCTAAPRNSKTTRTGATWCCSTSTFTATPVPGWAPATRLAGPAASRGSSRPMPCSARICCFFREWKRRRSRPYGQRIRPRSVREHGPPPFHEG